MKAEIDFEDTYPKGRMLKHCCRVFDPESDQQVIFLPSGFKSRYIEVYEDCNGMLDVRYKDKIDAPKGVKELLENSWEK